ncbi:MAG: ADP-ribose pyrophosphatase [uncultured Corynebacteriales bacterium]|uniref:ADP-ribose pyrophosphatase n=1 Tax=uncultured Mycobacteriales bacterium TaxID=581187 RepID=A0A6J4JVS2_9ACTN|nr:MAG: ADP-ribose pyrophosphatase [uncultured Corynebacteriales bacterium]
MSGADGATGRDAGGAGGDGVVRQVGTREVYRNRWLSLREDEVRLPDGSPGIYSVVDKPDFALVIPAERDGFHLVEQYRYPVGGRFWEFPQGTAPAGTVLAPVDLARAELAEETGLRAGTLEPLGHLHCAYGMSSQGFDVFLATDLTPGEAAREATEQDMRQRFVPRAEFEAMIRGGRITDDSTLAAYALLLMRDAGRL